jgi:putative oxidoreductase
VIGLVFFMHGSQKVFGAFGGKGLAGAVATAGRMGFEPDWLWGHLLAGTEFIGGALLLLGLLTRYAALALCVPMAVAVFKAHWAAGFFGPAGFEYPLTLLLGCISLLFSGPGGMTLQTGRK